VRLGRLGALLFCKMEGVSSGPRSALRFHLLLVPSVDQNLFTRAVVEGVSSGPRSALRFHLLLVPRGDQNFFTRAVVASRGGWNGLGTLSSGGLW
jgi:hypothetical protein